MRALIAGSGIAGPCLGAALRKLGWGVTLFEAKPSLRDEGAGFMLSPNGLRMLDKYLDKNIFNQANQSGTEVKILEAHYFNGEKIFDLSPNFKQSFDYSPVGIKRYNFHKICSSNAKEQGVNIVYGKTIKGFDQNDNQVKIHLSDGSTQVGDLLIGCDGIHSQVRKQLFGDVNPSPTGKISVLGLSKDPFSKDPKYESRFFNVFGNDMTFGSYPVGDDTRIWFTESDSKMADESWVSGVLNEKEFNYFKSRISDWNSPVIDVVNNSYRVLKWGLFDRPALKTWHQGNVGLVGDAAHPMAPHLGQGANTSLEDSAVLAYYLSKVKNYQDISKALYNYEKKRISRTSTIVKNSRNMGTLGYTKNAIFRKVRDNTMRLIFSTFYKPVLNPLYGYDFKKD
ncbi:FAD/NAD(P)-binding domain-containing protein [Conidiobolus coronatus NRRL 28638]|uniref:FAD/NAD(P)-binding domain-containing protein n=1 Tax=Conidiobolus coronatus (strain ATCC 28846 / CBS 209.66 / NRRL 28638) TaxID=796925 RepID=A0A137P545_CONC2|nr:FAD/NAD(P)-binding domain-containing protein [Conidiobolus coronatus NRRL 28638]|eukprot:KXN70128.1 FAD/NAD(P)-binding domain-containing protein [Conidiobolus coronatus NRRL 28638]